MRNEHRDAPFLSASADALMNRETGGSRSYADVGAWSGADLENRLQELRKALQDPQSAPPKQRDRYELEAQRIELEMQNRELRELQAEMQASRDLYADLYDFAPQTYLAVSREGLIRAINLTGAQMLGWERGNLTGKPLAPFVHAEDQPAFFTFLRKLFEEGERTSREIRFSPKGGSPCTVVLEGILGSAPAEGTPFARLAVTDITERKRAEAIKERENRVLRGLQAVQHTVREGADLPTLLQRVCQHLNEEAGYALAWIAQPVDDAERSIRIMGLAGETRYVEAMQGRVSLTWGPGADGGENALGYMARTGEYLVSNSLREESLWAGRDIAHSMGMNAAAGLPLVYDDRVVGLMGLYAWDRDAFDEGEMRWLLQLANELATAWATLAYQEQHRQSEQERQYLLEFLNATPDFVAMADVAGNVLYRNPGAYRLLGQDPAHRPLESIRMSEAHPQWSWHRLLNEAFPTARQEGVWQGEMAFLDTAGREIPVHQVIVAHYGDDGSVERFSTIAHDLTAFKRQRAELERTRRSVALDELGSVIAHQLNQPLTAALMYADGTLNRWQGQQGVPDGSEEGVVRVKEQVQKAVEIVQDLRKFLNGGKPQLQPLDLNALIERIGPRLILGRETHQHHLREDLDPDLPEVSADSTLLQECLQNLVNNAAEAMQEAEVDEPAVDIRTRFREDGMVEVQVRDSGVGLPETLRENLNQPLFTTKPGGIGLGVGICRSVVEAHGGVLWATPNDPEPGTTFHFTLKPVEADPEEEAG
ncbi:ATP-binding protein [Thiohalorhabdus methylotrophus]|uniref:histidine kinase n=1 Tax=Thiohalorhabdus methylotrophus TaxID=3242694 RepID=A0ABV4TWJ6_9GAMM